MHLPIEGHRRRVGYVRACVVAREREIQSLTWRGIDKWALEC